MYHSGRIAVLIALRKPREKVPHRQPRKQSDDEPRFRGEVQGPGDAKTLQLVGRRRDVGVAARDPAGIADPEDGREPDRERSRWAVAELSRRGWLPAAKRGRLPAATGGREACHRSWRQGDNALANCSQTWVFTPQPNRSTPPSTPKDSAKISNPPQTASQSSLSLGFVSDIGLHPVVKRWG